MAGDVPRSSFTGSTGGGGESEVALLVARTDDESTERCDKNRDEEVQEIKERRRARGREKRIFRRLVGALEKT